MKLVRDNIPDIIKLDTGADPKTRVATDHEYLGELRKKLVEESIELQNASNVNQMQEELADVVEVIDALMNAYGWNGLVIQSIRNAKREMRGAFEKRIILE